MAAEITLDEKITRANKKWNNKYTYLPESYEKVTCKIDIICPEHGKFRMDLRRHYLGRDCRKCGDVGVKYGRKIITTEQMLERFKEAHGDKYIYPGFSMDKIVNIRFDEMEVICPVHGIYNTTPHRQSMYGCNKCAIEYRNEISKLDVNKIFERFYKAHKTRYTYENFKFHGIKIPSIITCRKHGDFPQRPQAHYNGAGCPECIRKVSLGETKWLNSLGIPKENRYKKLMVNEKRFFYADGFDPATNTVYEFNGDYWHGNPKHYKPNHMNTRTGCTMGELYQYTLEKERLLRAAGFLVVSIWESDWKYLQEKSPELSDDFQNAASSFIGEPASYF